MYRSTSGRRLGLTLATLGVLLGGAPEAGRADEGADQGVLQVERTFAGAYTGVDARSGGGGRAMLGELGVRTLGLWSFTGGRWLTQWDAALASKGGWLGSAASRTPLAGGRGLLDAESGLRLEWHSPLSLYVGGHLHLDVEWLEPGGRRTSPVNDISPMPGLEAQVKGRVGMGASYLDDRYSLLLVAFAQSARRPTTMSPSGTLFTEGGLAARLDLGSRLTTSLEATLGRAGVHHDPALGLADRTTHAEVAASVRATFPSGVWVGVGAGVARETERIVYGPGGTGYAARAPDLRLSIAFGIPVRR